MYSQYSEEQAILNYFSDRVGILLDIGANDGKTFSNSRALLEKGWYGVLVEPSPIAFKMLEKNSAGFLGQLHEVAIGTKCGETEFYESGSLVTNDDHSLVSSMIQSETFRWKKKLKPEHRIVNYRKIIVPMIDFATLFKNSGCAGFDFITIDTEGMDIEILKQMDLWKLECQCICIEYNGKNAQEFDRLIPFPLIYKNRTNLIYGRKRLISA